MLDLYIVTLYVNYKSYCHIHLRWNKTYGPIEKTMHNIFHHSDVNYIRYNLHYKDKNESYQGLTYNELVMDLMSRLSKYPNLNTITYNKNHIICKKTNDILYAIVNNIQDVRKKMTSLNMTRVEKGNEVFDKNVELDASYMPKFISDKDLLDKMIKDILF